MIVVVNKYLLAKGFKGVSLWPFIIVKYSGYKGDEIFINHEKIHLRQQLELLIIPFYLWYTAEFLIRCLQYKNAYKAYRNISFEKEAYQQEKDFSYLSRRNIWSFLKYL
ncbi:hypothetical protein [Autumnicola musiva]|uniref:Peptidase M56 domain-containing protein n=1 Tax=Autumnicola musiva TaxID=3075589 RepID=A0ABU3D299_9FLAO|nr:hypothetical protein [Zunongwangia sp. F117]MDT0675609.1 hypothetical protein [Zunongwangia sp. F117]